MPVEDRGYMPTPAEAGWRPVGSFGLGLVQVFRSPLFSNKMLKGQEEVGEGTCLLDCV